MSPGTVPTITRSSSAVTARWRRSLITRRSAGLAWATSGYRSEKCCPSHRAFGSGEVTLTAGSGPRRTAGSRPGWWCCARGCSSRRCPRSSSGGRAVYLFPRRREMFKLGQKLTWNKNAPSSPDRHQEVKVLDGPFLVQRVSYRTTPWGGDNQEKQLIYLIKVTSKGTHFDAFPVGHVGLVGEEVLQVPEQREKR